MKTRYWLYIVVHAILFIMGAFLIYHGGIVAASIGASLLAAGVTGWVTFLYVFVSASAADRLNLIDKLGLKEVFEFRSVGIRQQYEDRLHKAKDHIDIIGFGLRALREDFAKDFRAWSARAQVRVLLLDPEFPTKDHSIAKLRDKEEGNQAGSIETDVKLFAREAAELAKTNNRFQIRLYRTIPAINYFRIDNEAFWGPYFIGTQSRNTPTFLVSRSGTLFTPLANHFENIWSSNEFSREIPKDWLQ
jgi:hypothetical protein